MTIIGDRLSVNVLKAGLKMKIRGFIGGMSWESTQHYYQSINQYVHAKAAVDLGWSKLKTTVL